MTVATTSETSTQAGRLSVEAVHFGYHTDSDVLRGVTAALEPGRVCALVGPNAAGKSTLLRIILGQLSPTSGAVTLGGVDVTSMSARQRAGRISYVPQRGEAGFAFKVREVVAMGRFALRRDEAAVAGAIEACHLTELTERSYVELSVGQQQRVLLARAIAQAGGDPAASRGAGSGGLSGGADAGNVVGSGVMLLDEPVSAMDLWHVHRTMSQLRELAAGGLAVLAVLHDLNLAATYADDAWLLHGGVIEAAGTYDAVLRPDVLEPVYGVRLQRLERGEGERPVLLPAPGGTL